MDSVKIANMKIVTKIIISFLVILTLSIFTVGYLIKELNSTAGILKNLYSTYVVSTNSLSAEININDYRNNLTNLILSINEKDEVTASATITKIVSLESSFNEYLKKIKKWIKDEKGVDLISQIEELNKKRESIEEEIIANVNKKDFPAALANTGSIKGDFDELIKMLRFLNNFVKVLSDDSINFVQSSIDRGIIISISISLLMAAIFIIITIFLPRSISRSISFFKEIFSKGASGHLKARYPVKAKSRDEMNMLGIFFNDFMGKIHGLIKEVADASNELSVSSEQFSATITGFTGNLQNQAASSEEVTATMEEISAGVESVSGVSQFQFENLKRLIYTMNELTEMMNSMAERISNAQGLSENISEQAMAGNDSLNSMNTSMAKINESSNKVSAIVEIIDDISNKINLLSLNAAIEAARAGDAGKGFAVVADEISKLADQTASSINDINSLINENLNEINKGSRDVKSTVDSMGHIIEGVGMINNMMAEIYSEMKKQQTTNQTVNKSADELSARSGEVTTATEEQRNAVAEVMKSITNINDITQASASAAEELTANANGLASLAGKLMNKIAFFELEEVDSAVEINPA